MIAGTVFITCGAIFPNTLAILIFAGHIVFLGGIVMYVGFRNTVICMRFERLQAFNFCHDLISYCSFFSVLVGFVLVFSTTLEHHMTWDFIVLYTGIACEAIGVVLYLACVGPISASQSEEARAAARRWRYNHSNPATPLPQPGADELI